MLARWLRALLGIVGVLDLVIGAWAVVAPHGFFTTFPGFGHHWVGAYPPYNEHLVLDTGAGFLAVGIALIAAAVVATRTVVAVGILVMFVKEVPHFLFHLFNPADRLGGIDQLLSTGSIGLEILLGIVTLVLLPPRAVGHDPTSFFRGFAQRSYPAPPPSDAEE